MNGISKSALEVQYDLRPAKQVERRMLLDTFQRLAQAGHGHAKRTPHTLRETGSSKGHR